MQRIVGALAALLLVIWWSVPASAAPPELVAAPEGVSIGGLTPGGRVAVFGVMRRFVGVVPGFERFEEVLADDDGDGRVEVTLEEPATPEWSQWIAVDLRTGEWATAGRSEAAEPARSLATGGELAASSVLWPVPEGLIEVLVVRPGEDGSAGAWAGEVWDGGSADGDGEPDGVAGVAPGLLQPVGGSGPAPESYAAGDVLIAVTPRALRHGITRVVAGLEGVSR